MDVLPSLSSFTTLLLSFCASRMPPSLVAMIPSALLPSPCQTSFHRCPAAITPGISVTVYSRGLGGPPPAAFAGAGPGPFGGPPLAPPPRAWGGTLQVLIKSAYPGSRVACTPGPDRPPAGCPWPNTTIEPATPNTAAKIFDFITSSVFQNTTESQRRSLWHDFAPRLL